MGDDGSPSGPGPSDLVDLRERLQAVADELADLAIDRLRRAVDQADPASVAAEERRLTRARRAVEKAIALLGEREA